MLNCKTHWSFASVASTSSCGSGSTSSSLTQQPSVSLKKELWSSRYKMVTQSTELNILNEFNTVFFRVIIQLDSKCVTIQAATSVTHSTLSLCRLQCLWETVEMLTTCRRSDAKGLRTFWSTASFSSVKFIRALSGNQEGRFTGKGRVHPTDAFLF